MGGRGSGRRPTYSGRDTTEESLPLDIRRLQQTGVLAAGCSASWQWTVNGQVRATIGVRAQAGHVVLSYQYTAHGQPAEAIHQTVWLETTPCTLGGRRRWFGCPSCGRRVAVIYGAGRLFACRRCKGLAYASQGEGDDDRAARRAERVRKRLRWEPGFLNGPGRKPLGMHWRTYERLVIEHDRWVAMSIAGMAARLGLNRRQLEDLDIETLP